MSAGRVLLSLLLLVTASSLIYAYYCYAAPQSWDETFHVKSSLHSPSEFGTQRGYAYAIDHPPIKRHVYRWVLNACGVRALDIPDVDYSKGEKWNAENGRLPALRVVMPLRITNAVFAVAALVLVYFAALAILRQAYFALLATLPLVLSQKIALGVVGYVGCDAMLAFALAASLLALVVLAQRGKATTSWGAMVLGAAGGLAVCVKFNGALVIMAFCAYLVIANRGIDRVVRPLTAALVCGVIFAALNPVVRGGGMDWALGVLWDMLGRRSYIWQAQYEEWPLSRAGLVALFFPYAAFLFAAAAALVRLRKEKWVLPVSVWGLVLTVGTLISVNRTYARYFLPVEMAVFVVCGVAAWRLIGVGIAARAKAAPPRETGGTRWGAFAGAVSAGVAGAIVLATFVAGYEPLGAGRAAAGSPAGKARVFYEQAAAFYGFAPALPQKEVRGILGVDSSQPRSEGEPAELIGTLARRVLTGAAMAGGVLTIILAARGALSSGALAVLFAAPLVWLEWSGRNLHTASLSEGLFVLFGAGVLYVLVHAVGRPEARRLDAVPAALCAGACAAASPAGILVAGAAAGWFAVRRRGLGGLAGAALVVVGAAAAFAALEPIFWRLGATATFRWMMALRSGALSCWTARFADTTDFLMPFNECFPYWPLLPLGVSGWLAARGHFWGAPAGLFSLFLVGGAILTLPSSLPVVTSDVNLALCVGAGLPGLALLAKDVSVKISLRNP